MEMAGDSPGARVQVTAFLDFAQPRLIVWFPPSHASSGHLGLTGLYHMGLAPPLELPSAPVAGRGRGEVALSLQGHVFSLPRQRQAQQLLLWHWRGCPPEPETPEVAVAGLTWIPWRLHCRRKNMHLVAAP